jgi:hypothetical protein
MKKIITLLFSVGLVASAFAQSDRDRAADVILGGGRHTTGTSYPTTTTQYPTGSQQDEINAINRDYDNKVASVQANGSLSQAEKDRIIRQLNAERARRINAVNRRYGQRSDNNNNNGNGYNGKKNGKDNGNHYGWQKGKGNPHRDENGQGNGKGKGKGKKHKGGDDRDDD